ncbi:MAG: large-conductance mechanosensitive channel protein MscL [Pirellulales bacterium]|nr:large-conductance mechanosensitive channel protein MscL [Pirellulales bacterium]
MGMLKEFRDFAMKGNVVDMAVGIIIGGAFGKIVSSLVTDIVMPPIGLLLGGVDFSKLAWTIRPAKAAVEGGAKAVEAVTINYGLFINTVLDFVIIAGAIFIVIKQMNRLRREEPAAEPTTKPCPRCFTEIPIKATRCPACTSDL